MNTDKCDSCHKRQGRLTSQFLFKLLENGEYKTFIIRLYTCQWCKAAFNRTRKDIFEPMEYVEYLPDEEVLKQEPAFSPKAK